MSRREIVHVHDLRKVYYLGNQEVHALRGIDLTLLAGWLGTPAAPGRGRRAAV